MNSVSVYHIKNNRCILRNYVYLIVNAMSDDAVMVDPAGDLNQIRGKIAASNASLRGIFLTHCHDDHVNLAESIANEHNIPVYASKVETDAYQFNCPTLVPLENEDTIQCGDLFIKPFFTPGHTIGSCCYQIGDNMFTGDTLFIEGCGLCLDKGSSPEELYYSLKKLINHTPMETKVYPGHSYGKPPGLSFDYLLDNNIYLAIKKIEHFVAFRMRKNQFHVFDFQ